MVAELVVGVKAAVARVAAVMGVAAKAADVKAEAEMATAACLADWVGGQEATARAEAGLVATADRRRSQFADRARDLDIDAPRT